MINWSKYPQLKLAIESESPEFEQLHLSDLDRLIFDTRRQALQEAVRACALKQDEDNSGWANACYQCAAAIERLAGDEDDG